MGRGVRFCGSVAAGESAGSDGVDAAAVFEMGSCAFSGSGGSGGSGLGVCEIGVLAAALDFEHLGELRLETGEAAAEIAFLTVEIGEGFGCKEAFEGDGFKGSGVHAFDEFGEELLQRNLGA